MAATGAKINTKVAVVETVAPLFKADVEAKKGVAASNAAGQAAVRLLLELLVAESTAPPGAARRDDAAVAAAFGSREAYAAAYALVSRCLRLCARGTRDVADDAAGALTSLGLADAIARDISGAAAARRAELQASYDAATPRHAGLAGVRWRTDVILSSSVLSKVMRTSLTLELELDTGRVVTCEVPVERLHELRHGVAKCLLDMGAIEGHPVLKV